MLPVLPRFGFCWLLACLRSQSRHLHLWMCRRWGAIRVKLSLAVLCCLSPCYASLQHWVGWFGFSFTPLRFSSSCSFGCGALESSNNNQRWMHLWHLKGRWFCIFSAPSGRDLMPSCFPETAEPFASWRWFRWTLRWCHLPTRRANGPAKWRLLYMPRVKKLIRELVKRGYPVKDIYCLQQV